MYTLYAAQTTTGQVQGKLFGELSSWARVLNGLDSAQAVLYPDSTFGLNTGTRELYRALTEPAKMSLLIDWNGTLTYAGPIWTRTWDGSTLTLSSSGVRSLLALRKLANLPSATWLQNQSYAYTDSLPHIMQQLVQFVGNIAWDGASLPITCEANSWGDSYQPTWYGFDLQNIDDLLTTLTAYEGGPDVDFQPVWNDATHTAFHWVMRTGDPYLVTANMLSLDTRVPESPVTKLQVTDDASKLSTVQHAKGSGSDTSTLMSHYIDTALTSQGWPVLEQETDYTTVIEQATLDQHTKGDQQSHATKTVQFTATVTAGNVLGAFDLGDLAFLNVRDHVWIPDGDYDMRIIQTALSSDSQDAVDVTMQEEPDANN